MFPISDLDPDLMETLGYTATETLLWDYSFSEEYYVLAKPPARRVRTLYRVTWEYAYQWFGLNGSNNLTIVYYPFSQIHFRNLTNPCDCPPESVEIFASISVDPSSVLEDDGAPMIYTVTLDISSLYDTTVNFDLTGTAVEGVDYVAVTHSVTITAGQTTGTFAIYPIADPFFEGDETVIATLIDGTSGVNVIVISATNYSSTGTIITDDVPPPLAWQRPLSAPVLAARNAWTEAYNLIFAPLSAEIVTWDPDTAVNVTLSNGNLTATNDFAVGVQGVTGTVSHTTGKYYFEITCTTVTGSGIKTFNWGIGQFFALSNTYTLYSNSHFGGAGGDQIGVLTHNGAGTIFGLNLGSGLHNGDVIGIAVDLDTRGLWTKLVGGPDFPNPLGWNGASSSDPVTEVGPVTVTTGDMFPIFTFNDDALTQSATFNFGGSAFVGALPAGYSAWDAAATLDPTTAYKVILSNGNLTVTNESVMEPEQIVSIQPAYAKSSGKYYYEITLRLDSSNNGNVSAVFGLTTGTYAGLQDDGLDGIIIYESGNTFSNEIFEDPRIVGGGGIVGADTGDVIGIAIDLDHGNAWFNIVAGPNSGVFSWNGVNLGDLTQDPSTNKGGVFLRAGDRFMPFAIFRGDAGAALDAETANFGATPFIGPVPTGFTSGWPVSGGISLPTVNTWDPTTAIGCVTSNGNLTVTNQGAAATVQGVKALVRKTFGKFYFEITLDSINPTSTNFSFGVAMTMTNYSEIIGVYDMSQVFTFLSGAIRQNGGSAARSIGLLQTGDVIGVAVELQNNFDGYVWFKVVAGPDAAGAEWNGIIGGTPSNIFDGVYIDGNTVLPFVIFDSTDATDQVTANFGASAFQGAVPQGFNAGWIVGSINFTNFGWYEPLSVPAPIVKAQPGFSSVPFNTAQLSVNFKNFGWSQPLSRPLRPARARVLPYNVPIAPKVASGLSWQQPLSVAPTAAKARPGYSTNTLK